MESTRPIGTSGLIQTATASREMLYELEPNLDT